MDSNKLGQYFTVNENLQNTLFEFIRNQPKCILEPSLGQGHLLLPIFKKNGNVKIEAFEIDEKLQLLPELEKYSSKIKCQFKDFLETPIKKKYLTIIGNPPFIKSKNGNLYLDFIRKCYQLLLDKGELIFIVPSDFIKIKSAQNLIEDMVGNGSFTDFYFPNKELLFEHANVDVMIFRYQKDIFNVKTMVNCEEKFALCSNGMLTFRLDNNVSGQLLGNLFSIYVGMVSGKESVFKNSSLGQTSILIDEMYVEKYILIDKFPTKNTKLNEYLLLHKDVLENRKIRKFNEKNWFEWGALRNIGKIREHFGQDCIYIRTITRKDKIAFVGRVQLFGGQLLCLIPKDPAMDLESVVEFLNSQQFLQNFMYSGRIKVGHRQISNSLLF